MRPALGWILLIGGALLAVIGFCDAGTAWWTQYQADAAAVNDGVAVPEGFVSRLSIPRLDASLYVVTAETARDLKRGPGYIRGSVGPGERGNCIIAGHRDLHFRVLKDIQVGDEIELQTKQDRLSYKVSSIDIVSPDNRGALRAVYPEQLTLVTCFPFYYVGPAPKRFIVKAYRLKHS